LTSILKRDESCLWCIVNLYFSRVIKNLKIERYSDVQELRLTYEELITNNSFSLVWDAWKKLNSKDKKLVSRDRISELNKIYIIEEQILLLDAYLVLLNHFEKSEDIETFSNVLKDITDTDFLGCCSGNLDYYNMPNDTAAKLDELSKIHAFRCLLVIFKFLRIHDLNTSSFNKFPGLLFSNESRCQNILKLISQGFETNNYKLAVFTIIKGIYIYLSDNAEYCPDTIQRNLNSLKPTIDNLAAKASSKKVLNLLIVCLESLNVAVEELHDIYHPIFFHCLNVILNDVNADFDINNISNFISLLLYSEANKNTFFNTENNVYKLFLDLIQNYLNSQNDILVEQICFAILDSKTNQYHLQLYELLSNLINLRVPVKRSNLFSGDYYNNRITSSIDNLKIKIPGDTRCELDDEIDHNFQFVNVSEKLSMFNNILYNWKRLLGEISNRSNQFIFIDIVRMFLQIMQSSDVLFKYIKDDSFSKITEIVQYIFETLYTVYKYRSNQPILEVLANDAFDLLLSIQKIFVFKNGVGDYFGETFNFCKIIAENIQFESKQGFRHETISIIDCLRLIFTSLTSYGNISRALQFIQKFFKFVSVYHLFNETNNKTFILDIYQIFTSFLDRIRNIQHFFVAKDLAYLELKSEILLYSVKIIHTLLSYVNFNVDKCNLRMLNGENDYLLFIQACLETYNFNEILLSLLYPDLDSKSRKDKISCYLFSVVERVPDNLSLTGNITKTVKYTLKSINAILDICMFFKKWNGAKIIYINLGYLQHWYDCFFNEGEFPCYDMKEKDIKVDLRLTLLSYTHYKVLSKTSEIQRVMGSFKTPKLYQESIASLALNSIGKILLLFSIRETSEHKKIPSLSNYLNIVRVKFVKDTNQHSNILSDILTLMKEGWENTNAALELFTLCIKYSQIDFIYPLIQYNPDNHKNENSFWHLLDYFINNKNFDDRNKYYLIIALSTFANTEATSKYFIQELVNNKQTVLNLQKLFAHYVVDMDFNLKDLCLNETLKTTTLDEIDTRCLENLAFKAMALLFTRLILFSTPTNKFAFKEQLITFFTKRMPTFLQDYYNNIDDDIIQRLSDEESISNMSRGRGGFVLENMNKVIEDRDDYFKRIFRASSAYNYGINFWLDKKELYIWGSVHVEEIDLEISMFNLNLSLFDSKTLAFYSLGYLLRTVLNIGVDNTIGSRVNF
jgi:hypothetical protein